MRKRAGENAVTKLSLIVLAILSVFASFTGCEEPKPKQKGVEPTQLVQEIPICKNPGEFLLKERGITKCELFDATGKKIKSIETSGTISCYRTMDPIRYVKCYENSGEPTWHITAMQPLCAFNGDEPSCMRMSIGDIMDVSDSPNLK